MQLKCIIVKEMMFICLLETNHVFLLSIRPDPLRRRAISPPTSGRFALIPNRNYIDQNQFRDSQVYDGEHLCPFSLRNIRNYGVYGRKCQAFGFFVHPLIPIDFMCIYKCVVQSTAVKRHKVCQTQDCSAMSIIFQNLANSLLIL